MEDNRYLLATSVYIVPIYRYRYPSYNPTTSPYFGS